MNYKRLGKFLISVTFLTTTYFLFSQIPAEEKTVEFETVQPSSIEIRGVCVFSEDWVEKKPNGTVDVEKSKQNILQIIQNIASWNFNIIVFQARTLSEVLYPSQYEPWAKIVNNTEPGFDPLLIAIEEAHKNGIKIFPLIDVFTLYTTDEIPKKTFPQHLYFSHGPNSKTSWVCVPQEGYLKEKTSYYFLSAGIPEVQTYLRTIILDIVKRYDIDGIVLDNVLYPAQEYSHDKISQQRFFTRGNLALKEWYDWQREQLNKFVVDVYSEIFLEKPHIVVAYIVNGIYNPYFSKKYYSYRSGFYDHYQDSIQWLKLAAADYIIPKILVYDKIDYLEIIENFLKLSATENLLVAQKVSVNQIEESINRIKLTREKFACGHIFFSYRDLQKNNFFVQLKNRIFKEKIVLPQNLKKLNGGIILGRVLDEDNFPVVDAWVSLLKKDEVLQSYPTSADGRFSFIVLSTEPLKLIVEYDGAEKQEISDIVINKREIKNIDIILHGAKQAKKSVFYRIFSPPNNSTTTQKTIHILGRTLPTNKIRFNDSEVKVFSSGAFVIDNVLLSTGVVNNFQITVTDIYGNVTSGIYSITQIPQQPVLKLPLTYYKIIEPSEDILLLSGDVLEIKVKGPTKRKLFATYGEKLDIPLIELIDAEKQNEESVYYARIKIPEGISVSAAPITIQEETERSYIFPFWKCKNRTVVLESEIKLEIRDSSYPIIGETIKQKTAVTYGLHYVRLGGPFLAELPKGTKFEIIGKKGTQYNIKLSKSLSGWVSQEDVKILPIGTPVPHAYFTYISVSRDKNVDKVWVPLNADVVYSVIPKLSFNNQIYLEVNFFNTHFATTWCTHKAGSKVVGKISIEQIEDDWVRMTIPIKSKYLWGWWVEKVQNGITIYVKHPPKFGRHKSSSIVSGLTFAIEAGHGGENIGAIGLMGTKEKTVNLQLTKLLKNVFEKHNAKVVELRVGDSNPNFDERLQLAYDNDAVLIISIHANAGSTTKGYLTTGGTSVYYKYDHCYLIAKEVYKELLSLWGKDFGLVGNFNYSLLRNTKIPAILIEQGFLTNPEDEAKILDSKFRQLQAEAILRGIEKFLSSVKE